MAEHTPTPWKWHQESKEQEHTGSIYSMVREGHAYAVAMMPRYQTRDRWAEDAAFIVKAVNNHEALMKALQDIDERLESFGYPPTMKTRQIARKALAAVGGVSRD